MESNIKAETKEETNNKNNEMPETIKENNINSLSKADTQEVKQTETPIKNLKDSTSNNINNESSRNEEVAQNVQSQTNYNENNLQSKQNNEQNMNNQTRYKSLYIYIFGFIVLISSIIAAYLFVISKKEKYIILDDEGGEVFIEDTTNELNAIKSKAIISIDFGSSYSGFAIAFAENSIESKVENIQPSTIVIQRDNLKGYRYGNDAENFMNEPRSEEYIYFDRIKTKLDPKFKNDVQSKIYIDSKYPPNYKINLRIIITEYLKMFSDDALKYYNQKGNTKYTKNDIKWIVIVPVIWNEYGKQFMRNCAKKAGMNKVLIALEPEAASLTMFKDDNVDQKYKEKGKVFMLIDAGGYTLDITINEIVDSHGNLKQLSPPSGGAYGSMNINDYLIKIVEETFTKEKIANLIKNRYDLWKITLDSIEKKKKELRGDESDANNYKIDIRLENICEPGYFGWIFGKKCNKKISYGIVEYDNKYLYIPKDMMKKILLLNINKIINHI